jgi:hypothetical protein
MSATTHEHASTLHLEADGYLRRADACGDPLMALVLVGLAVAKRLELIELALRGRT